MTTDQPAQDTQPAQPTPAGPPAPATDAVAATPPTAGASAGRPTEAELRAAPPSIYVRTLWFATRVALRVGGTLVMPILVFWLLYWTLGDVTEGGPFSSLAVWSWGIVSVVWALVDSSRRPVVMNLITWVLVFLGVGAVMTLVAFTADWRLTSDAVSAAMTKAIDLVLPGSLVPAAAGIVVGTLVRGARGLARRGATPA